MVSTIDDVTLVDMRVVSKYVSAYGTVLCHVVIDSTAGGLSFGRNVCRLNNVAWLRRLL